jgi:hypothetical protein
MIIAAIVITAQLQSSHGLSGQQMSSKKTQIKE